MPVRCTFQKGSHIQERKKNSPRNGVIVSADPAFKGQKHHWLVKFDGERKPVPRTSNQLLHIKNKLGSSSSPNKDENSVCSTDDDDFFWSRQDDPDDLIDKHAENRTNSTLQESDEAEEVDPDNELEDDIVENHDEESNPYVPNMTDMENAETHKRKWIEYNEDSKKWLIKHIVSQLFQVGQQR